mmetsp:Transcript_67077/g.106657  ORF Transcript_67077/g.106657 Transcript_67077/m.106657 type:complete len:353 (+) Transcript_67077:22-1080(+)
MDNEPPQEDKPSTNENMHAPHVLIADLSGSIDIGSENDVEALDMEIVSKGTTIKQIEHFETSPVEVTLRDAILPQKRMHIFIIGCCIFAPLLLQIAFLVATYENDEDPRRSAVSDGIGYHQGRDGIFSMVFMASILSVFLSFFVSVCRQIQIAWVFEQFCAKERITRSEWKAWRALNFVAVCFNVLAHIGIVLLVRFDGFRHPTQHKLFAFSAVVCSGTFIALTSMITFKQRNVEFRENLEYMVEEKRPRIEAFKESSYYADAMLLLFLFIAGAIGWVVYAVEFIRNGAEMNALGYIFEWIGFFSMDSGALVLGLSFHLTRADKQIYEWWRKHIRPQWCLQRTTTKFVKQRS